MVLDSIHIVIIIITKSGYHQAKVKSKIDSSRKDC